MFYTASVAFIIYKMKNDICNETDHDTTNIATFARNSVFERGNPQLLNQSELNNILTVLCTE